MIFDPLAPAPPPIPAPAGLPVAVTIPPLSSSGEKLRLKGLGIKSKNGQGDEIINLMVMLPKAKSADLTQLADKMENYAVRSF